MEATLEKNKKWYKEKENITCQETLTAMAMNYGLFGDKFGKTEYEIEKWIVKNFHDNANVFMSELLIEIIERSFNTKLSEDIMKKIDFKKSDNAKGMAESISFILDDIFKDMLSKEQEKERIFLFNMNNFVTYTCTYGQKVILEWLLENLMTEFELKDIREFFNRMEDRKLSYNEVESFLYDNLDDLQEYVNTDEPDFRLKDEIISYVKDIMFGKKFSNSKLVLERNNNEINEALRKAVTKKAYNIKIDKETGIPIPEEAIKFGHNNEQEILPKDYMSLVKGVHQVMLPVFDGLGIGNEKEKRVIGIDKNQEKLLEDDDKEIINEIVSNKSEDSNKQNSSTKAEVITEEKEMSEDEKDVEAVKEILNSAIKEAAPQDKKDLAIIKNTMTATVDKYNKAIGKLNSIAKKSKPQNKKIFTESSNAIQELMNKRQNK